MLSLVHYLWLSSLLAAVRVLSHTETCRPPLPKIPPPANLRCNALKEPVPGPRKTAALIKSTHGNPEEFCISYCWSNIDCKSFTYDPATTDCSLYRRTGAFMGLQPSSNRSTRFWNRDCFEVSPADDLAGPFRLRISGPAEYEGLYISNQLQDGMEKAMLTNITTNDDVASTFNINCDARLESLVSGNSAALLYTTDLKPRSRIFFSYALDVQEGYISYVSAGRNVRPLGAFLATFWVGDVVFACPDGVTFSDGKLQVWTEGCKRVGVVFECVDGRRDLYNC